MIKMNVLGLEKVSAFARRLAKVDVRGSLEDAVKRVAYIAEGAIKIGITDMRAVDTGFMRASTRVLQFKAGLSPEAHVGPEADYAIYVHEGTSRMRARPFIPFGIAKRTAEIRGVMIQTGHKLALSVVR